MQKLGWFGWLRVTQGHRKCNHLIQAYDFLLNFNRNYVPISYHFSSYYGLFVENGQFYPIPPAFGTPIGVTQFKFCRYLWHHKTRVPELSCGIVCVILCLAVLTQYQHVTDGQTHDNGTYCANIASHSNDEIMIITTKRTAVITTNTVNIMYYVYVLKSSQVQYLHNRVGQRTSPL